MLNFVVAAAAAAAVILITPFITPSATPHDTYFFAARCLHDEQKDTVENMQGKNKHLFNLAGFTSESERKIRQDARNKWTLENEWKLIRLVRELGGTEEEVKLLAALSYAAESVSAFDRSRHRLCNSVENDVSKKGYKFNFFRYPGLKNSYHLKMGLILAHLTALIYWHPNSRYYQDAVNRATQNGTVELKPLLLNPVVPCAVCGKGVPYPDASLDAQELDAPHLPSTVGITHRQCNLAKKSMGFGESAAFMFFNFKRARDLALTTKDKEQSSKFFKFSFNDFAAVYDNVERHRNDITVPISKERRYNGKFQGFGMSLLDLLLDEKIPFTMDYKKLDDAITNKNQAPDDFRRPGEQKWEANKRFKKEREAKCADIAGRIWNPSPSDCSIFSFVSPYGSKTTKSFYEGFEKPTVVLDSDYLPIPNGSKNQKAMFEELKGDSSVGDTQSNALILAIQKCCAPLSKYLKYWGRGEEDNNNNNNNVPQNFAAAAAGGLPGRAAGMNEDVPQQNLPADSWWSSLCRFLPLPGGLPRRAARRADAAFTRERAANAAGADVATEDARVQRRPPRREDENEDGPSRVSAVKHAIFWMVNVWLLNKHLDFTCACCGQKERVFAGGDRGDCDGGYQNLFNVFPVCYACNIFRRRFWEIETLCVLYDVLAEYKKFKAGMEYPEAIPVATTFSASARSLDLKKRTRSVAEHLASGEFAGITMDQVDEKLYEKLTIATLQTDAQKEKGKASRQRVVDAVGKETVNCPCCNKRMLAKELRSHVEDNVDEDHEWYFEETMNEKGTQSLGSIRRVALGNFKPSGFPDGTHEQIKKIKENLSLKED